MKSSIRKLIVWSNLTLLPVGTDPVKLIFDMSLWAVSAAPVEPSPATTLNTPLGNPASLRRDARATVDSGVYSEHWGTLDVHKLISPA